MNRRILQLHSEDGSRCAAWHGLPAPTSDFPPDPEPLERDVLNSTYLELRNCYSSLMRSRAQHRRLANKAKD
ncbi:MAG: hypothetical protein ACK5R2_17055, partial [Cyanobacteriota bacterium]